MPLPDFDRMVFDLIREPNNDSEDDMSEEKTKYAAASPDACAREKYWNELGIEEKVERMRWAVKHRLDRLERLVRSLDEKVTKLEQHEHGGQGRLVIPLNTAPFGLASDSLDMPRFLRDQEQKGEVFF